MLHGDVVGSRLTSPDNVRGDHDAGHAKPDGTNRTDDVEMRLERRFVQAVLALVIAECYQVVCIHGREHEADDERGLELDGPKLHVELLELPVLDLIRNVRRLGVDEGALDLQHGEGPRTSHTGALSPAICLLGPRRW